MIDIDATLINAHTEKEGAAVNYRSGSGFIRCWRISMRRTRRWLACCAGRACAFAQAQIDVLDLALAQLPVDVVSDLRPRS